MNVEEPRYLTWAWCVAFKNAAPCVRALVYKQRRYQYVLVGRLAPEFGEALDKAGASFNQMRRIAAADGYAARKAACDAALEKIAAAKVKHATKVVPTLTIAVRRTIERPAVKRSRRRKYTEEDRALIAKLATNAGLEVSSPG